MSRRPNRSGAAELFRATSPDADPAPVAQPGVGAIPSDPEPEPLSGHRAARPTPRIRPVGDGSPSGRERHEEKITVYCSPEELLALETARLTLRAHHGLAIDRGRIVREAVAVVLADLAAKGESSILVGRLRQS